MDRTNLKMCCRAAVSTGYVKGVMTGRLFGSVFTGFGENAEFGPLCKIDFCDKWPFPLFNLRSSKHSFVPNKSTMEWNMICSDLGWIPSCSNFKTKVPNGINVDDLFVGDNGANRKTFFFMVKITLLYHNLSFIPITLQLISLVSLLLWTVFCGAWKKDVSFCCCFFCFCISNENITLAHLNAIGPITV